MILFISLAVHSLYAFPFYWYLLYNKVNSRVASRKEDKNVCNIICNLLPRIFVNYFYGHYHEDVDKYGVTLQLLERPASFVIASHLCIVSKITQYELMCSVKSCRRILCRCTSSLLRVFSGVLAAYFHTFCMLFVCAIYHIYLVPFNYCLHLYNFGSLVLAIWSYSFFSNMRLTLAYLVCDKHIL